MGRQQAFKGMGDTMKLRDTLLAAAMTFGMGSYAMAADMPLKAPPPPPAPLPFSWAGFYIGGNIGGVSSHLTATDLLTGVSLDTRGTTGFMGGGQLGYNFQFGGGFVLGGELDGDWTSIKRTSLPIATTRGALEASASMPWLATAAARFGFASDRFLVYGKAGGASVDNKLTVTNLTTGLSAEATKSRTGWVVGAGVEFAVAQNWTVKLEYDHIGLDHWTSASPIIGDSITVERKIDMVKVGFNYLFNAGSPVVARY
jgi:outer membrane immunogenic protein